MKRFKATVVIECATKEEAEVVLAERLGYDEDYGFTYRIRSDWNVEEED